MIFIVETGEGVIGATSYVDVAFAKDYFEALGKEAWGQLTEDKQMAALNAGSLYADLRFAPNLPYAAATQGQGLALPMRDMYGRTGELLQGIPLGWKRAVCEYALLASKTALVPQANPSLQNVEKKSVKVGPITTAYEYSSGAVTRLQSYPQADGFIINLFPRGQFGGNSVIR